MEASRGEMANFWFLALAIGLASVEEVIAWADSELLKSDVLDPRMIDLSFSHGRQEIDVMSALREFIEGDAHLPLKMIAGTLWRRVQSGALPEVKAANMLYRLYVTDAEAISALGSDVACIDEYFEGWMYGPEAAPREVRAFLNRFQTFVPTLIQ